MLLRIDEESPQNLCFGLVGVFRAITYHSVNDEEEFLMMVSNIPVGLFIRPISGSNCTDPPATHDSDYHTSGPALRSCHPPLGGVASPLSKLIHFLSPLKFTREPQSNIGRAVYIK